MNKLYIDKCPVCGHNQSEKVMTCTDHYATGESFDLFRCTDCGFIFTQNAPVESEIGRYYETPDYISHSDTHKGVMNSVYHIVRKHMLVKKAKLVEKCSGICKGRILDIGTGTGYFPNMMNSRGWKVYAVEKSTHARNFAKEHFGIDTSEPEKLFDYDDNMFDVVTLWHVMEHLEQLEKTWTTIYRILKDSGTLVVAVPNAGSYDAKKYRNMWAAYDVPRHLWHFTPSTICQLAKKYGFSVVEKYPMPFDAFYVSMLTEKYKKSSLPFVRGMITGLLAGFSAISDKEKSSSMIYIFRKKR